MPTVGKNRFPELVPTITDGAYADGDVIGGRLGFNVQSTGGDSGLLTGISIFDVDNQKPVLRADVCHFRVISISG